MSIKLRYDKHPEFPAMRVRTEDESLLTVARMMDSDLQSPDTARKFAAKLREVVAGRVKPYEGSGNSYVVDAGPVHCDVWPDYLPDPPTVVTVTTADLIDAIEEWAAHLEHNAKKTGSYF